jgi:CheY-like chemotaxis protein
MARNVLIVDDDQDLLLMTRDGLGKYRRFFSVQVAEDGESAVEKLRRNDVSLVVTDLKMPRMDGFGLLAHILEHYPEVPVIVITAYGTPEIEERANRGGAVGYIQKPFIIDELARKIIATLRMEAQDGVLHDFSVGAFIQLIEAEGKTCTIRVFDRGTGQRGALFFREGELVDARLNEVAGLEAAHAILSWDHTTLSVQYACARKQKRIDGDLQGILLEAMRRKDHHAEPVKS